MLIAMLCLLIFEVAKEKQNYLILILVVPLAILLTFVNVDYGWYGILLILAFYFIDIKKSFVLLLGVVFLLTILYIYLKPTSIIQLFAIASLFFIYFNNGERGKGFKYFFYIFYPAHLIIIAFIKLYC